jgi:hypothetical protein
MIFRVQIYEGKMKMIGISNGGTNEIKYPKRNNHASRSDFIHPLSNEEQREERE